MQTIKPISTSNGKPVLYAPLALILAISAIKDLVEDLKRRRDDKRENFGKTQKLTENGFVECRWMDLKVGDIVKVLDSSSFSLLYYFLMRERYNFSVVICYLFFKVQNNEYIPADLLLLKSSETNGIYLKNFYVENERNFLCRNKELGRRN